VIPARADPTRVDPVVRVAAESGEALAALMGRAGEGVAAQAAELARAPRAADGEGTRAVTASAGEALERARRGMAPQAILGRAAAGAAARPPASVD
jgi:hypothetical protein